MNLFKAAPNEGNQLKSWLWATFYAAGLLAMLWCLCWKTIGDGPDVWSHAAIGRWIVEHHAVPRSTLFLWSAQQPWVAHSWASEILLYELINIGGEQGGPFLWLLYNFLTAAVAFGALWWLWASRQRPGIVAVAAFVLAFLASERRFQARPESLTSVCFSLLLVFLVWWQNSPSALTLRQALWRPQCLLLLLLFGAWANLHGAVAFGILLLLVTAMCDAIQDRFSPRSRALLLLSGLSMAMVCFNPVGWHLWSVLLPIRNSVQFRWIDEWKPIWQTPIFNPSAAVAMLVLWSMALWSWWHGERRLSLLVWLIVMGLAFLQARRNVWLLSLTCLALLAMNPKTWVLKGSGISRGARQATRFATGGLLALISFVFWPSQPGRAINVSTGLAAFLAAQPKSTRLLNHYDQSPYLEWHLRDGPKLFLDVNNAYPDSVLVDYLNVLQATPRGQAFLNSGLLQMVAMPLPDPGGYVPPLFPFMASSPRWKLVYQAPDGIVWKYKPTA